MVGNGSFVEMAVNAPTYKAEGIMAMASACAVSECFEILEHRFDQPGPAAVDHGCRAIYG